MLTEKLDFPSPTWASWGTTGVKSIPGFAVPDSVHQVKVVSPRKLPLRFTETWANNSAAGTSMLSAAISILEGPEETPADGGEDGVAADFVAARGTPAPGATMAGTVGATLGAAVRGAAVGGARAGGTELVDAAMDGAAVGGAAVGGATVGGATLGDAATRGAAVGGATVGAGAGVSCDVVG
jgi:hypothetical protein